MNGSTENINEVVIVSQKKINQKSSFDDELSKVLENSVSGNYAPQIKAEKDIDVDLFFNAPDEWNYFAKPGEEEYSDLLNSICSVGLQQPIVAWQITIKHYKEILNKNDKKNLPPELLNRNDDDEIYMILAGHTRVRAYKDLKTLSTDNFNLEFSKISARVYDMFSTMDEEIAQQIIIDTNFLSRKLSTMEMSSSILKKYALMGDVKNKRIAVSNQLGLKERQITRYTNLSKLTDELQEYVNEGKVTIANAQVLCSKPIDFQDYIYDNLSPVEINKFKNVIRDSETQEELSETIEKSKIKESTHTTVSRKVDIPNSRLDEFTARLDELLKEFK